MSQDLSRETGRDGEAPRRSLPVVIATSVIRSAYQGQSHGGVYLVDLEGGFSRQVVDWDDPAIDWSGRGGDRGLRGIAFWREQVLLAASDEIFVYDREFNRLGSFRNPYLKHCHEIAVAGDRLYTTSSGYDGVLTFDLVGKRFIDAVSLRYTLAARAYRNKIVRSEALRKRFPTVHPAVHRYDPNAASGPGLVDTVHVNSVAAVDGRVYACGRNVSWIYDVTDGDARPYARVPEGTHNAQPYGEHVVYNHTLADSVCVQSREGELIASFELRQYPAEELLNTELATGAARQGFGRGLAFVGDDLLIVGSSPATITVYDVKRGAVVTSVNLSMDVRNAVHGLEVWPFSAELSTDTAAG